MSAAHTVPHTRILIGLVAGAVIGCTANALVQNGSLRADVIETVIHYVTKPIGDVFLNLLFMAIIPLVFASLAVGVTRLGGTANLGRVGLRTIGYFLVTTTCAAIIGLSLVNAIRPGDRLPDEQKEKLLAKYSHEACKKLEQKDEFGINTFVNVIPRNPLEAFLKKDMLAVIFTALVTGIALTRIEPGTARTIIDLLEGINQIADFILRLAMRIAPYAVFALIFSTTAELRLPRTHRPGRVRGDCPRRPPDPSVHRPAPTGEVPRRHVAPGVLQEVSRHDGDGVQHEFIERHPADRDEMRGGRTGRAGQRVAIRVAALRLDEPQWHRAL